MKEHEHDLLQCSEDVRMVAAAIDTLRGAGFPERDICRLLNLSGDQVCKLGGAWREADIQRERLLMKALGFTAEPVVPISG